MRAPRGGYAAATLIDDVTTLVRTLLVTPLAYVALVAAVRLSGKRALAKLNAFDLVVTVALGSVLASMAVSDAVTLVTGATAFLLLVLLQFLIAFFSARQGLVRRLVKASPTLLVRQGTMLEEAMLRERVTRSEVLQVLRQHGCASLDEVAAVVLETDGTLSVLGKVPADERTSTLADVTG